MPIYSIKNRKEYINQIKTNPFDLVVIGGGITGAGIAWDATLRGLKVLLLEQNDFASGTSSKSTKLIHGGLRYLKQLKFKVFFQIFLTISINRDFEIAHKSTFTLLS